MCKYKRSIDPKWSATVYASLHPKTSSGCIVLPIYSGLRSPPHAMFHVKHKQLSIRTIPFHVEHFKITPILGRPTWNRGRIHKKRSLPFVADSIPHKCTLIKVSEIANVTNCTSQPRSQVVHRKFEIIQQNCHFLRHAESSGRGTKTNTTTHIAYCGLSTPRYPAPVKSG